MCKVKNPVHWSTFVFQWTAGSVRNTPASLREVHWITFAPQWSAGGVTAGPSPPPKVQWNGFALQWTEIFNIHFSDPTTLLSPPGARIDATARAGGP